MAFHYKTQGIILKQRDAGEANRVVTVFTKEYGKLTLWAVSVRKITSKLRGGLELFCLSQLEFVQGRHKKVLVEAVCVEQHASLVGDLARLQAASHMVRLIDQHLPEEEKSHEAWNLLCSSLASLENGSPPRAAYQSFSPRFMALAGYGNKPIA